MASSRCSTRSAYGAVVTRATADSQVAGAQPRCMSPACVRWTAPACPVPAPTAPVDVPVPQRAPGRSATGTSTVSPARGAHDGETGQPPHRPVQRGVRAGGVDLDDLLAAGGRRCSTAARWRSSAASGAPAMDSYVPGGVAETVPEPIGGRHPRPQIRAVADVQPLGVVEPPAVGVVPSTGAAASAAGQVVGRRPPGPTAPSRTSASAVPNSIPGNQTSSTAATSSRHGISTGAPGVDHDHRPRVGRGDGTDQLVLPAGQRERRPVDPLALHRLGGPDDDHGDVAGREPARPRGRAPGPRDPRRSNGQPGEKDSGVRVPGESQPDGRTSWSRRRIIGTACSGAAEKTECGFSRSEGHRSSSTTVPSSCSSCAPNPDTPSCHSPSSSATNPQSSSSATAPGGTSPVMRTSSVVADRCSATTSPAASSQRMSTASLSSAWASSSTLPAADRPPGRCRPR